MSGRFFAGELESGDRIGSGQSFRFVRSHGYAVDTTLGELQCDMTVDSVRPSEMEPECVVISLRGSSNAILAHRSRVVRCV